MAEESESCISHSSHAKTVAESAVSSDNPDFDLKTARWKDKLDKCIPAPPAVTYRQRAEKLLRTPYVVSVAVFFVSLLLLLAVRPPMVHTPGKTEMERGKLSVVRLVSWSLVAAVLALVLPMALKKS